MKNIKKITLLMTAMSLMGNAHGSGKEGTPEVLNAPSAPSNTLPQEEKTKNTQQPSPTQQSQDSTNSALQIQQRKERLAALQNKPSANLSSQEAKEIRNLDRAIKRAENTNFIKKAWDGFTDPLVDGTIAVKDHLVDNAALYAAGAAIAGTGYAVYNAGIVGKTGNYLLPWLRSNRMASYGTSVEPGHFTLQLKLKNNNYGNDEPKKIPVDKAITIGITMPYRDQKSITAQIYNPGFFENWIKPYGQAAYTSSEQTTEITKEFAPKKCTIRSLSSVEKALYSTLNTLYLHSKNGVLKNETNIEGTLQVALKMKGHWTEKFAHRWLQPISINPKRPIHLRSPEDIQDERDDLSLEDLVRDIYVSFLKDMVTGPETTIESMKKLDNGYKKILMKYYDHTEPTYHIKVSQKQKLLREWTGSDLEELKTNLLQSHEEKELSQANFKVTLEFTPNEADDDGIPKENTWYYLKTINPEDDNSLENTFTQIENKSLLIDPQPKTARKKPTISEEDDEAIGTDKDQDTSTSKNNDDEGLDF